jgi:hypothetical protein
MKLEEIWDWKWFIKVMILGIIGFVCMSIDSLATYIVGIIFLSAMFVLVLKKK